MVERSSMSVLTSQHEVFGILKREYGVMKETDYSATAFFGVLLEVFQEHNNTCGNGSKAKRKKTAKRLLHQEYKVIKE